MKHISLLVISLVVGCMMFSMPAVARPLSATCETTVSVYSWMPLRPQVIKRLVQARVLAPLLRRRAIALKAGGFDADVHFEIHARIIEDSGDFSVYVSATPHERHKRPSVAAMKTASLLHKKYHGIQMVVERTARAAGEAMAGRLATVLASLAPKLSGMAGSGASSFAVDFGTVWGKQRPRFRSLQGAKEAKAHHELAYCAMGTQGHHRRKMAKRRRCLDALAQLARTNAFAQRAIIAVLLEKPPRRVGVFERRWRLPLFYELRKHAFRLTTTFSGAALAEAKQAWLRILGHDFSNIAYFRGYREDSRLARPIADYFVRHPGVPNLDVAVAKCVTTSHAKKGPAPWCRTLVAAFSKYAKAKESFGQMTGVIRNLKRGLSRPPSQSDGYKTWLPTLDAALKAVGSPLPKALVKVCVRRIARAFYGTERERCIEALGKRATPDETIAKVLTEAFLTADEDTINAADAALVEITSRNRKLCAAILKAITPFVARGNYPSYPHVPLVIHYCNK